MSKGLLRETATGPGLAIRGLLLDMARGHAKGLLGVREPVEVRPKEPGRVVPGDTAMGPIRWLLMGQVEGMPRLLARVAPGETAMGPVKWLLRGPLRMLEN